VKIIHNHYSPDWLLVAWPTNEGQLQWQCQHISLNQNCIVAITSTKGIIFIFSMFQLSIAITAATITSTTVNNDYQSCCIAAKLQFKNVER